MVRADSLEGSAPTCRAVEVCASLSPAFLIPTPLSHFTSSDYLYFIYTLNKGKNANNKSLKDKHCIMNEHKQTINNSIFINEH